MCPTTKCPLAYNKNPEVVSVEGKVGIELKKNNSKKDCGSEACCGLATRQDCQSVEIRSRTGVPSESLFCHKKEHSKHLQCPLPSTMEVL